ncbi:MAG: hypothetical protein JWM56_1267 [Candidatus Peribacteria bacterium]|nr:hypothetical protein [Candidatus Peribacteria bacterium]
MLHIQLRNRPFLTWKYDVPTANAAGWVALCTAVITSSTYGGFAKNLSSALSPLSLLFVSQLLIAFFVLFSFGAVPTLKRLLVLRRQVILPLIAVGLTNGVIAPLLWFTGIQTTVAVNAALFGRMDMIFMFVLAWIFIGEKITRRHLISGGIIFLGILVVVFQGFQPVSIAIERGDLLILLACFTFAVGSMIFRLYLHAVAAELVILCRALTGICCFFIISPFLPYTFGSELQHFPLWLIPALLGFCFIAQFMNMFSFYQAIERLPIATISLVTSFEIIGSALFAHWYLHEPFMWYHIAGGLCILLGVLILEILGTHATEEIKELHLVQERSHST